MTLLWLGGMDVGFLKEESDFGLIGHCLPLLFKDVKHFLGLVAINFKGH